MYHVGENESGRVGVKAVKIREFVFDGLCLGSLTA